MDHPRVTASMSESTPRPSNICFLGAGNLGLPILRSLLRATTEKTARGLSLRQFNVCVRSEASESKLTEEFRPYGNAVFVTRGSNEVAVKTADVVLLAVDPADVAATLKQPGIAEGLASDEKLLISVAAGWSRQDIETTLFRSATDADNAGNRAWVLRSLPNIAAQVGESMTAVEVSDPALPEWAVQTADGIFSSIGRTCHIPPSLMDATTAVAGSTPAFFAIICDALIDAAVAVGVPRPMAQIMISQSMLGTATLMRDGLHPSLLRDQGTSPEGCTIGGLMVLEEGAVRGTVGRGLREAVTIARQMGKNPHVNDTRQ